MAFNLWFYFSSSHFDFYLLVYEWCAPTDTSIVVKTVQKEIKAMCRWGVHSAEHNLNIELNIFIQKIPGNSQTGHIQQKPTSSPSSIVIKSNMCKTSKILVLLLFKEINLLVVAPYSIFFSLRRSCAFLGRHVYILSYRYMLIGVSLLPTCVPAFIYFGFFNG